MEIGEINKLNVLALAYLGDAVWDLAVRKYLITKNLKVDKLNILARKLVSAKAQSKIYKAIFDSLGEYEKAISKRARNAKINSFPKSCTANEYKNATAFEALLAYYDLSNNNDKIDALLNKILEGEIIEMDK